MSAAKRALLLNPEVIAVDQDASATAGDRLRGAKGDAQLWARPLANGDQAVLLYNSARLRTKTVAVSWAELGWAGATVRVRDVWARKDIAETANGYNASVAPHDVAFLRLTKVA